MTMVEYQAVKDITRLWDIRTMIAALMASPNVIVDRSEGGIIDRATLNEMYDETWKWIELLNDSIADEQKRAKK
jgi:hypothetical protein